MFTQAAHKSARVRMQVDVRRLEERGDSRPRAWLRSVQFKSGPRLEFGSHEIIVIVGPNNSGKSLLLRELQSLLFQGRNASQILVGDGSMETDSNTDDVIRWARSNTIQRLLSNAQDPQLNLLQGQRIHQSHLVNQWNSGVSGGGFHNAAPIFSTYLQADGRLNLTQIVNSIDSVNDTPNHPLQRLYEDDDAERRLSKLVQQAFGEEIVVNRGAGSQIHLHLGDRPRPPEGKDRLSREYREAVHDMQLVSNQGDGVKAFVGILLNTLVLDRDISLIDEPEAFLHPPQAKLLGRILATETPRPRQLVVATHSSDVLKGLLDVPESPVRVIRIRRDQSGTSVAELNPDLVREAWKDPLLRFSGIFDGLFHQGVIVCESDSDCRFYGAMMSAVAGEQRTPDLLLVHGGGKTRIPAIVCALHAIQVPVRAVFDFDVLGDELVLRETVQALGGDWSALSGDWRIVKAAIENKRPELQTKDVREKVTQVLEAVKQDTLPADSINRIRNILRSATAWSEAKRTGKPFLPRGQQTSAYERLAEKLCELGVYLVEVGELEGFCPSLGGHGPAWTVEVLERDLAKDAELESARAFARALLAGW
jgi:predicted ATPase